ncbi:MULTISPECIES: hypothetical protein [unclassified Chamaesiphon]|uniref:hypothetical protein n=1 Tax=unclassified Chamaesiphon TaxID=2620921 RepID=UPI00286C0940|nr:MULTISPECIES: hypothetical protein [unclassified Chamaesiphon]
MKVTTNNTARGVGEVGTLTSCGADKFIFGDRNGVYSVGNGSNGLDSKSFIFN